MTSKRFIPGVASRSQRLLPATRKLASRRCAWTGTRWATHSDSKGMVSNKA